MNLTLKSDTGREAQVETGFSWTALFFGGFPFFFRGLYLYGGLWLGGSLFLVATVNALDKDGVSFGALANTVMAVLMNKLTVRHYLRNGYKPISEGWGAATEKLRIGAGTYTLIVVLGMSIIISPSKTEIERTNPTPTIDEIRKAAEETKKAAEQGDAAAMLRLANSYYNRGDGTPKDMTTAVDWYVKAAEAGSSKAAFTLGVMYSQERSISKDLCAAKRWYEKADALGDSYAKLGLVLLYDPRNGDAIYHCE